MSRWPVTTRAGPVLEQGAAMAADRVWNYATTTDLPPGQQVSVGVIGHGPPRAQNDQDANPWITLEKGIYMLRGARTHRTIGPWSETASTAIGG